MENHLLYLLHRPQVRNDQNLVQLALIFPDDDRADLHMPSRQALLAGAEEFANARIKTSQGF